MSSSSHSFDFQPLSFIAGTLEIDINFVVESPAAMSQTLGPPQSPRPSFLV